MKVYQIERLLNLIDEIRRTSFYDPALEPEKAEAAVYIVQQQLNKLKIYAQRVDDNFIKSEVDKIIVDFDYQHEAINQYNKTLPILEEIEDFLIQEGYESISNLSFDNSSNQSGNQKNIENIKKEIIKGNLELAIKDLIPIFQEKKISDDELILAQNRLSTLKLEYQKGLIPFEDFLRHNTSIVVSILTKMNELK